MWHRGRGATTVPTARRRWRALLAAIVVRAMEIAIIVAGVGFLLTEDEELLLLSIWDLLAALYIGVGVVVLRRSRRNPVPVADRPSDDRFRFNFPFALLASLMGLAAAVDIAVNDDSHHHEEVLAFLGVLAMIMSWMLLQAGYARRYAAMDRRGPGLVFPDTARPSAVDFVYFAVTIGTAFSVSDVQVTTARMRWHVLVHSVISFFYNAAVVGYALSLFAGR